MVTGVLFPDEPHTGHDGHLYTLTNRRLVTHEWVEIVKVKGKETKVYRSYGYIACRAVPAPKKEG